MLNQIKTSLNFLRLVLKTYLTREQSRKIIQRYLY